MAKRKSRPAVESKEEGERAPALPQPAIAAGANPLVFISHDSRDADLAEAFDHLLTDASGGVIQTFRSSDQTGRAGIDYGEDWFSKITRTLSEASDVVALLTPNSVDRPWILFEAGFAVGQRSTKVYGIALGVAFAKATSGPFARFQNCEAKENPVTTVVLDLIRRNQRARPREEAVRRQVATFLSEIDPMLKKRAAGDTDPDEMDATAAAKLFEEVKVMFRDLPSRVEGHLREQGMGRRRRKLHPMMFEEVFHFAKAEGAENPAAAWLFISSFFREEVPWLSDIGLQLYHAYQAGNAAQVEQAQRALHDVVRMARHSRMMMRGPDCTGRNANVFYEIGIAHTIGREVILITQHDGDIPFDLRHLRYVRYLDNGEGRAALAEALRTRLHALVGG